MTLNLGDPNDLENFAPFNGDIEMALYNDKEVSWKCYTYEIKNNLIKGLFNEFKR